jgi:hypothetical protein
MILIGRLRIIISDMYELIRWMDALRMEVMSKI